MSGICVNDLNHSREIKGVSMVGGKVEAVPLGWRSERVQGIN